MVMLGHVAQDSREGMLEFERRKSSQMTRMIEG
jgi:hypothetical protein